MHELSLMKSVFDTIKSSASANNMKKIIKIKLVVGDMTMAEPESLRFAFTALAADTIFQDACLEIETKSVQALCKTCQTSFAPRDLYDLLCPDCQGFQVDIISGRELFIDYFEGE